jgi:hypothetical protein
MYNAVPHPTKQYECQKWIMKKYPAVWDELQRIGSRVRRNGIAVFSVNVKIEP